jgi:hypothetical protein
LKVAFIRLIGPAPDERIYAYETDWAVVSAVYERLEKQDEGFLEVREVNRPE